mmetsp:Transcript_19082/g.62852  ORF Transcript_19082/g.62852 Transcript_19082/m.62852 type:complete len:259 (-) Transcript_19082:444-1220(-)
MVEPELEQLRDGLEDADQEVLLVIVALPRHRRGRQLLRQARLELVEHGLGQGPSRVPPPQEALVVCGLARGPHAGCGDPRDVVMRVLVHVERNEEGAACGAVGEGHGAVVDDEEELAGLDPEPLGRCEEDLENAFVPPLHQRLHQLQHPQVVAELLGPPAAPRAPLRVPGSEDVGLSLPHQHPERDRARSAGEMYVVACHLSLENELRGVHEDHLRPAILVAGDGDAGAGAGLHDEVDGHGVAHLLQQLHLLLEHLVL